MLRPLKLTGLRREVLTTLAPGRGEGTDTLRRKLAQGRGLTPGTAAWLSFGTSFARALRLLEEQGVLELRRESSLFGKPCLSWVALGARGVTERARLLPEGESPLGNLVPEGDPWGERLERASDSELERLERLLVREKARRGLDAGTNPDKMTG